MFSFWHPETGRPNERGQAWWGDIAEFVHPYWSVCVHSVSVLSSARGSLAHGGTFMRKAFAAIIGILATLLVPVTDASAQALAVYDNFNSAPIDALRWRGFEQAAGD